MLMVTPAALDQEGGGVRHSWEEVLFIQQQGLLRSLSFFWIGINSCFHLHTRWTLSFSCFIINTLWHNCLVSQLWPVRQSLGCGIFPGEYSTMVEDGVMHFPPNRIYLSVSPEVKSLVEFAQTSTNGWIYIDLMSYNLSGLGNLYSRYIWALAQIYAA